MTTFADDFNREGEQLHRRFIHHTRPKGSLTLEQARDLHGRMAVTEHELKSWPEYFEPVFVGLKKFELRKDDRNFNVGDTIKLREWKPTPGLFGAGEYTGRTVRFRISYILRGIGGSDTGVIGPLKGLERGYCILGLMESSQP